MEKGQSQNKTDKGMDLFFSGRSFAVLFATILLSVLVFNHLKKKKKSAEKESTEGAYPPYFSSEGAYDVFLSFRGLDTRKEFTDHLYHRLCNAGTRPVRVFRDDNSLEIGEEFGPQLLNAIKQSKISIPIISENYASSKWCLRELIHIMDCKKSMSHIVLPIFYKVNPSDVRYLQGSFGKAFDLRKKRFDDNIINEGRQALADVSYLNGWESKKIADGHEGELVEMVVKKVLSKLQPVIRLDVTKHLVGFGDHAKNIRSQIDASASDAQIIGIYGMGGIGKTTLAKIVYNELSNDFVHHIFLPNIRETTRLEGITYVQEQLINKIQPIGDKVSGVDAGVGLIKARVEGKKVLMLLDDIDGKDHLDKLAGQRDWFSSGSIIIVTTRYRAVLDQSEFKVNCKYELDELNNEHSFNLFERYAFLEGHSSLNFREISNDIISTLGGLPLALEVIGSYLREKSRKVWSDILKQLKQEPHVDVKQKLKISYDALSDDQKEIFLDIARFYIGKKREFTIYMWDKYWDRANQAIEELELRCLIKIGDDDVLWMHDQLRDLGRSIWQEKGTERIQLIGHDHNTDELSMNLQNPSFHQFRGADLTEDFCKLSSELRWLQWLDIESNPSFLTTMPPLRLVVLQLSYNPITEGWTGWDLFTAANGLKVLDLACCEHLTCTPNLSDFKNLEVLILKGCQTLERVHRSIGEAKSLISLDLSGCGSLHELPGELCQLESLEKLILDAAGITEIPGSIGSLHKLEKLSARACRSLSEIPSSIWDLQKLQFLDISESGIEKLPGVTDTLKNADGLAFGELKIILKDCYRLEQVDCSIGKVKSVVSLDLSGCGCLKELPGEVDELEELKELILDSAGITEIPTSIGSLHKLKKLSARACRSLRKIPSSIWDLQNLESLDISESAIEKLPGVFGRLKKPDPMAVARLKIILKDCHRLEQVPRSIGKIKSLVSLDLSGCGGLKELPAEVGELEELKELILDSANITEIPTSIGSLMKLEKLSARACRSLTKIPDSIGDLQNLQELDISDSAIKELPRTIGSLTNLWRLNLESCCSLGGEIPSEIGNLSSLKILQLSGALISALPVSIRNLSSLEDLSLEGCHELKSLPELPSSLKSLRISSQNSSLPPGFCPVHIETLYVSWTRSRST